MQMQSRKVGDKNAPVLSFASLSVPLFTFPALERESAILLREPGSSPASYKALLLSYMFSIVESIIRRESIKATTRIKASIKEDEDSLKNTLMDFPKNITAVLFTRCISIAGKVVPVT